MFLLHVVDRTFRKAECNGRETEAWTQNADLNKARSVCRFILMITVTYRKVQTHHTTKQVG